METPKWSVAEEDITIVLNGKEAKAYISAAGEIKFFALEITRLAAKLQAQEVVLNQLSQGN